MDKRIRILLIAILVFGIFILGVKFLIKIYSRDTLRMQPQTGDFGKDVSSQAAKAVRIKELPEKEAPLAQGEPSLF